MDFPIHIDTISMGLPIVSLKGSQVEFSNLDLYLSLKVILIVANSADRGEMQHYPAFHLASLFAKVLVKGFPFISVQRVQFNTLLLRFHDIYASSCLKN